MTARAYCTRYDAQDWLGGGAIRCEARLVVVDPAADTVILDSHSLRPSGELRLKLGEGGGAMPSPLVAGIPYYALLVSDSVLQLSATPGGTAIDITTAGSNVELIRSVPWDAYIAAASAEIDEELIGNAPVGDGPIPEHVRMMASALVLQRALLFTGGMTEDVSKRIEEVRASFERYRAGKPLRVDAPPATNTAVRAPATSGSATDSRGWIRYGSCGSEVIP